MQLQNLPRDRFGDNNRMADQLAALVVQGIKTASCSAYNPGQTLSNVGERVIIEDSAGQAICIIEVAEVSVIPFNQVSAGFAYDEGEGDRTLESWRKGHQRFFERNGGFTPDMLLVCERFRVVHIFKEI